MASPISIILPIQSEIDVSLAQRCIETMLLNHYRLDISIELILVNYGKNNLVQTVEQSIKFSNKVLIRMPGGNIVQAYNKGISKSTGQLLFLLEKDIYFTQPTLLILLDVMQQTKSDIVSPIILYPNQVVERAGVVYQKNIDTEPGWVTPRLRLFPYPLPFEVTINSPLVAEKCVGISRNAINRVGFLDENLNLIYAGADYCLKANRVGLKQGVIGYTTLIYDPGSCQENEKMPDASFLRHQEAVEEKNRQAFYRRWK